MNKFFSYIRLEEGPTHDRLTFWQGGVRSGQLVLTKGSYIDLLPSMARHADTVSFGVIGEDDLDMKLGFTD